MEKQELTLKEIQSEMLNVVLKIDEICNCLNIKYSLAYGSLIGAIRHNGFIPWDDDLDIWMAREDLDKFVEYCKTHIEELYPYRLCDRSNTENYSYNIPRFANFDFEYINTDPHQAMFDIGIFVDIYPIEGYGETKKQSLNLAKKMVRMNNLYDIYINPNSRTSVINSFIKKIISKLLHIIYKGKFWVILERKYRQYVTKYISPTCKYVGCVCWESKSPFLNERNDIFDEQGHLKIIKHDFECLNLNVLLNYDIVLKNQYGNYMELPPVECRAPHHDYKIYKRFK